jgi:hypothetical protein
MAWMLSSCQLNICLRLLLLKFGDNCIVSARSMLSLFI